MLIWRLEVITVFVLCGRSQRSYASDYNRDDTWAPTQLTVSLVTTSCDPLLHALTDTALRHDVEVGALLLSGWRPTLPDLPCLVRYNIPISDAICNGVSGIHIRAMLEKYLSDFHTFVVLHHIQCCLLVLVLGIRICAMLEKHSNDF